MAISIGAMKSEINKTGGSKGKILFIKDGTKKRIRFLCDFTEGLELVFHDSFSGGINCLCGEEYGEDCPYCDDEDVRTRKNYAWPVWDYDAKEVRILIYAANNCTPIPAIISMYENYETLTDRDFVIQRTGTQQNTSYTVIPQDKAKFRTSVKKLSEKEMLKIIAKAFPIEKPDDEDEGDEPKSKKKKKKRDYDEDDVPSSKKKKKHSDEEYEDDEDDEDDDDVDYADMSAKELYKLCMERDIKCKPKKSEGYYIELLEEADEEDEDEDEWDD